MKEFTFGTKSWHLYLANFGQDSFSRITKGDETDLCSYTRRVLAGLFWFSVAAILITTAATVTLLGFYDIAMWLFTDIPRMDVFGVIVSIILVSVTILLTIYGIKYFIDTRDIKIVPSIPEDSFVGLTYKRVKNKTCFKIKFQ
jgi:hypothetical protein